MNIIKFSLGCPCNIDCPNGCDGCDNSICKPVAKEAVLMLSTRSSKSVPMVIGFNGKHYSFFNFESYNMTHIRVTSKLIQARLMTI